MNLSDRPHLHVIPDQLNASIVGALNAARINDEAVKLAAQNAAFFKATEQIEMVRKFVANPDAILGSARTKHGEIAEQVEVGIRNARAALLQQEMPATFEGVGRCAPADYLLNGDAIQSKFINGVNSNLNHVLDHMDKYSYFGRDGSYYHIPKDTYETVLRIKNGLPTAELSEKSRATILHRIQEIELQSGKPFEAVVQPSSSNYADVQSGKVNDTLDAHDEELRRGNENSKVQIVDEHKPSLSGAAQAALIAGAVGGAISLGSSLYGKYRQGKNPFKGGFSVDDWREVGLDTAKGGGGGALAGAAIYVLTNNAALPAPFAGAIVSAAKGISSLLCDYNSGMITFEEFTDLGLIVCAESAIVGLATAAGQTLIPIPIVGAVIGSLAGKVLAEFVLGKGRDVAEQMRRDMELYLSSIGSHYRALLDEIEAKFESLGRLTEAAFQLKANADLLTASANLARSYGVTEGMIIHDHSELDSFMLGSASHWDKGGRTCNPA